MKRLLAAFAFGLNITLIAISILLSGPSAFAAEPIPQCDVGFRQDKREMTFGEKAGMWLSVTPQILVLTVTGAIPAYAIQGGYKKLTHGHENLPLEVRAVTLKIMTGEGASNWTDEDQEVYFDHTNEFSPIDFFAQGDNRRNPWIFPSYEITGHCRYMSPEGNMNDYKNPDRKQTAESRDCLCYATGEYALSAYLSAMTALGHIDAAIAIRGGYVANCDSLAEYEQRGQCALDLIQAHDPLIAPDASPLVLQQVGLPKK